MIKYYARHEVVDDLLTVDDDILKIAVNDFKNMETTVYPIIKEQFGQAFQISTSSTIWMDIMSIGINKGAAITKLQQQLDITPEQTMVFGDYLNDYEMMQCAYHTYAMSNAHPDIKETARFMTDSNDDNGVMNAIRKQLSDI